MPPQAKLGTTQCSPVLTDYAARSRSGRAGTARTGQQHATAAPPALCELDVRAARTLSRIHVALLEHKPAVLLQRRRANLRTPKMINYSEYTYCLSTHQQGRVD